MTRFGPQPGGPCPHNHMYSSSCPKCSKQEVNINRQERREERRSRVDDTHKVTKSRKSPKPFVLEFRNHPIYNFTYPWEEGGRVWKVWARYPTAAAVSNARDAVVKTCLTDTAGNPIYEYRIAKSMKGNP